jgi:hypothetical protein
MTSVGSSRLYDLQNAQVRDLLWILLVAFALYWILGCVVSMRRMAVSRTTVMSDGCRFYITI